MTNDPKKIEIVPAILPKSYDDMRALLSLISDVVPVVQIDVIDGVYAPNKTWPYKGDQSFERIVAGDEGMPFWDTVEFEFDLMVTSPAEEVVRYVAAGAARMVIHEHSPHALGALEALRALRAEGSFNGEIGIAIRVDATVADLDPFEAQFEYVQIMGIDRIGFQGQQFDERAFSLIKEVRAQYPHISIQVDGGVTVERAGALVRAGANRLIAGSAIFSSTNPERAYAQLLRAATLQ